MCRCRERSQLPALSRAQDARVAHKGGHVVAALFFEQTPPEVRGRVRFVVASPPRKSYRPLEPLLRAVIPRADTFRSTRGVSHPEFPAFPLHLRYDSIRRRTLPTTQRDSAFSRPASKAIPVRH